MFPKRFYIFIAPILITLILLSGCSPQTPAASAKQNVVATSISPLADLIRQVGGDKINVINLVPAGSDPHEYEPKPDDVRRIASASLFFANGVGEELYLDKIIANVGNPQLQTIVLSDGLSIIGKTQDNPGNPHLWLNVQNAERYVEKIRDALDKTYPDYKTYFDQNASRYLDELKQLDAWTQAQIATIPPDARKMVVLHDAWSYYAQRYGLSFVEPLLHTGEGEPSAKDYAQLIDIIRQQHVRAVFSEAGFNPKLVQQLASETGVKFVDNLYDDTLGNTPETNSYIAIMKFDTNTIVSALK